MAHRLAVALQQPRRIGQRCAMKKAHIDVRREYIDVAERRISQTRNRTAVMQKLQDFVSAMSHHFEPTMRDGAQFAWMPFHPGVDCRIPPHSAVESQEVRLH